MKCILAAVAGAMLASLLLVAFGFGWDLADPMLRERLFLATLNAIFVGWFAGIGVLLLGKQSISRAFLIGAALGICLASWFLAGFALALFAIALKRPFELQMKPFVVSGFLVHFLPILCFFGLEPSWKVEPLLPAPLLAASDAATSSLPSGTPDVVLIVCDTLRADAILDSAVPTPNLDALRARGMWAPFAEAPANQTLPSHLVLLAGFDIEKIGMRGNYSRWPTTELLKEQRNMPLANRFRDAGYRTVSVASNPLLDQIKEDSGYQEFAEGFDTWHGITYLDSFSIYMDWVRMHTLLGAFSSVANPRILSFPLHQLLDSDARRNYRTHYAEGKRTSDAAIHYLNDLYQESHPFFMLAQYFDPHSPYVPPVGFANTLATSATLPEGYSDSVVDAFNMRNNLREDFDNSVVSVGGRRGAYLHNLYKEEVSFFDQQVGRLLDHLEASGRPTIILFTSDHAEAFGEHHNVEHGVGLFEEEYRIPFILAGPGINSGELKQVPELIDAGFTLLELAGLNTQYFDGRNILTTDSIPARPRMTVMIDRVAMQQGPWVLHTSMRYADSKPMGDEGEYSEAEVGEYELSPMHLFHLDDDPAQTSDVLDAHPEVVASLLELIRQRMKMDLYPVMQEREFTNKEQAGLSALGYALAEEES